MKEKSVTRYGLVRKEEPDRDTMAEVTGGGRKCYWKEKHGLKGWTQNEEGDRDVEEKRDQNRPSTCDWEGEGLASAELS